MAFEHSYMLKKRAGGYMILPEEAIITMVYEREIRHEKTSHVGRDKRMTHYFERVD